MTFLQLFIKSTAVWRREEFRQPQLAAEEAGVSALGKADDVASEEACVESDFQWRF